MNFMFKFSGVSPEVDWASWTCCCMMCCSYFSSLSIKSLVNSRITVTNDPVTDWFIKFLNSIFWLIKSTAALAFWRSWELNLRVFRLWQSESFGFWRRRLVCDLASKSWSASDKSRCWPDLLFGSSLKICHLSSSRNVLFFRRNPPIWDTILCED